MKPFDDYPGAGRRLLGKVTGDKCRRGYCRRFMQRTGVHSCAYCGADLTASYEAWLVQALDHVVPTSVGRHLPSAWMEDIVNRVLACAACNTFKNRYAPATELPPTLTLDQFFDARDRIFTERAALIEGSHREEREFFKTRPWEPE